MPLILGDSPNVRAIPWVTWSIAIAHLAILVFIEWDDFQIAAVRTDLWGEPVARNRTLWTEHAFWPQAPQALPLLTGLFLHAGPFTALFGIWLLLIFGDNVEHHLGRRAYASLYAAGGIVGALIGPVLGTSTLSPPVVGSGAALAAVLGAYFVFFKRSEVRLLVLGRVLPWNREAMGLPHVPARMVILLALVVLSGGSLWTFWDRGVEARATDALISGFLFGVAAAVLLNRWFRSPADDDPNTWYPNELLIDERLESRYRDSSSEIRRSTESHSYLQCGYQDSANGTTTISTAVATQWV